MRVLVVWILAGAGAVLASTSARVNAQTTRVRATGLQSESDDELRAVKRWKPSGTMSAAAHVDAIDLRYRHGVPIMPPVGNQGKTGSCVSWASIAIKTYQEALDQQWIPDTPDKQLSPAFLWHQLNDGQKGRGTTPMKALAILQQHGAPPLSAYPWEENNFDAKPHPGAFAQARPFRIASFHRLGSMEDIKAQLRRLRPVLIGAVLDPIFSSGRYRKITLALRKRGLAILERRKAQGKKMAHGRHAMVIVGFDDTEAAFLIRNSWGSKWGDNGHIWVSYDLFEEVGENKEKTLRNEPNFIARAFVAIDRPYRVTDTPDKTLRIASDAWFIGARGGKRRWGYKLRLVGFPATVRAVRRVVWKLPEGLGAHARARMAGTRASATFEVHGVAFAPGTLKVAADVTSADGGAQTIAHTLELSDPKRRSLKLVATDRYYGRNKQNEPLWLMTVAIRGSITDRKDIKEVVYHLGSGFPIPDVTVKGSARTGFEYAFRMLTPRTLKADVTFVDGTTRNFSLALTPAAPVQDAFALASSAGFDEDGSFSWTAHVAGPWKRLQDVREVEYSWAGRTKAVKQGKARGFPLSRAATKPVQLQATLAFKDGTSEVVHAKIATD